MNFRYIVILLAILVIVGMSGTAAAWVYPEHRDITLLAIQRLGPANRAKLDQMWAQARKGYESRLDVSVADAAQGLDPKYIDYAAWPAIAGDHSVSADNLIFNILNTDWILDVADVTARAAKTVCASLEQIIGAATDKSDELVYDDRYDVYTPDTFNISTTNVMPHRLIDTAIVTRIYDVLFTAPIPGLATGLGEMPRFRSELGPFIGIAPAVRLSVVSGGFGIPQITTGIVPGLEFALHVGLGLDGVLNESGDGLVFPDLG